MSTKSWRDVLPIHPAAELFPLMAPDALRALGADIKKGKLREPITLWFPILKATNRSCSMAETAWMRWRLLVCLWFMTSREAAEFINCLWLGKVCTLPPIPTPTSSARTSIGGISTSIKEMN